MTISVVLGFTLPTVTAFVARRRARVAIGIEIGLGAGLYILGTATASETVAGALFWILALGILLTIAGLAIGGWRWEEVDQHARTLADWWDVGIQLAAPWFLRLGVVFVVGGTVGGALAKVYNL